MANLNMDLTGVNQEFASSNCIFKIYKYGQLVNFETPVYLDSIKVYLISSGISTTELVYGTDYITTDDFTSACDNAMSSAKLVDSTFSSVLVSGIQMIRGVTTSDTYQISVSYQKLYPNQLKQAYYNSAPIVFTPELLKDMVQQIEKLTIQSTGVASSASVTEATSLLLDEDISKTNPDNYIENEEHSIDVAGGSYIITPQCGSFYLDSVSISHSSGLKLVYGTDFRVIGMDEPKTKVTTHTAPLYRHIAVEASIVGTVYVSYHAFGGEPTIDNYKEIYVGLNNVVNYLNQAGTLTEDSIGSTTAVVSMVDRINKLENDVRRLMNTPSYGDITNGKCTLMKIFSNTSGLHWYTIASLHTIGESNQGCTADTFIFRLQTEKSHFQWQTAVSVDLNNQSGDIFSVTVLSDNYPRGYTPFSDYSEIDYIIRPQLRVVWSNGDELSGAYLQLGFTLTNIVEETVVIEDMSGHESAWKLVDEISGVTTPNDDNFLLPNGNVTWSSYIEGSQQESTLVPFKNGHLVWTGNQLLNRPSDGWQSFTVSDELLLESATDIRRISKLRLNIEEVGGLQFPVDICFNSGTTHLKGHASFTHQEMPVYVNAELYYDGANITIRLNYEVTAGISSNVLGLRDMVVFLN